MITDKDVANAKIVFNDNGFIAFDPSKQIKPVDIEALRWKGDKTLLLRDSKDAGSLKVPANDVLMNIENYVSLLSKYQLVQTSEKISGKRLFPINLAHLKSDEQTGSLLWHRDSYMHRGKQIGSAPPAVKLAVYLTDVCKDNGVTGFIPKSNGKRIKNRYIDLLYTYCMMPFAHYPSLPAGGSVLFDGSVIHGRPTPKNNNFREVIIFGLVSDPWLASFYVSKNEISREMVLKSGQDKYL